MADNNYISGGISGFGFTPETSVTEQKKESLRDVSAMKKAALSGNVGPAVVGQTEYGQSADLQNFIDMGPIARTAQYGSEANAIVDSINRQIAQTQDIDNSSRDLSQIAGDSALAVGQGAVTGTGGIAALLAGLASPDAGNTVAEATRNLSEGIGSFKSDTINQKSDIYNRISEMRQQDSKDQYDLDIESGKPLAGLRRFGRDIVDAASDVMRDPAILTDMTAQGAGSILPTVAAGLATGGSVPAVVATAAGMAAGEGYTQSQQEVMEMPFEQLAQTSELYNTHINNGMTPEEARLAVANTTGIMAGAIGAPIGAVGGKVTSGFLTNPLKVAGKNVGEKLENIGKTTLKEGLEEAGQGAGVQLGSNIAQQTVVDPNQDLLAGVATAGVTEGLAGLGTAGALQGPGALTRGAVNAVGSVAKAAAGLSKTPEQTATEQFKAATEALQTATEQPTPVAEEQSETVTEQFSEPAAEPYAEYVGETLNKIMLSEEDVTKLPTDLIEDGDTKIEVLYKIDENAFSEESPYSQEEKAALANFVKNSSDMLNQMAQEEIPESISSLPEDNPIRQAIYELVSKAQELTNFKTASKDENVAVSDAAINSVDASTPTGAEIINDKVVSDPIAVPENQLVKAAETLADEPKKLANIEASRALIKAQSRAIVAKEDLRTKYDPNSRTLEMDNIDSVSDEIKDTFNKKNKLPSLKEHVRNVISAAQNDNPEGVQSAIDNLGQFVQHLNNKVEALNKSLASGNPSVHQKYDTLTPHGWVKADDETAGSIYINPNSTNSMYLAESLALDTKVANEVLQNTVNYFSEFGATSPDIRYVEPTFTTSVADGDIQLEPTQTPVEEKAVKAIEQKKPEPVKVETEEVIQEAVKEPEVVQEAKSEVKEEKPVVKTMAEVIPNQVEYAEKVGITASFNTDRTNLFTTPNPGRTMLSIIKANGEKGLAARLKRDVSDEAREYLLNFTNQKVGGLAEKLNRRVADQVKAAQKEGKTPSEVAGRLTNRNMFFIDSKTGQYPTHISTAMAMAGTEWALSLNSNGTMDAEDISKSTGIPQEQVPAEMILNFNKGSNLDVATNDIKNRLKALLGYSAPKDIPFIYGENLLDGLVAEIVSAVVDDSNPLVETIQTNFNKKSYLTLAPTKDQKTALGKLKGLADVYTRVFTPSYEKAIYVGEAPTEVARTVKGKGNVPLKKGQRKTLEKNQNTAYFSNAPLTETYDILGEDLMGELLGHQEVLPTMHRKEAATIEGKNTSIRSSLQYVARMRDELGGFATASDTEVSKVPVFFKAFISSVGRMHMEGINPQSNKLIREMFTTTNKEMDLSGENDKDLNNFWLSVAQSVGVKINKFLPVDAALEGQRVVQEDFAEQVATLEKWMKDPASATDADKKAFVSSFGKPIDAKTLHALNSVARYNVADADGRKKFMHTLALEADGVTDGPLNALVHFWSDNITPQYINLLNAGGRFLGKQFTSVNDYFTQGNKDIYEMTLDRLKGVLAANMENVAGTKEFITFLSNFKDGINILEQDGEEPVYDFSRNEIKNPLTVFLYGSGINGINDKIYGEVLANVYSAISWALTENAKNGNQDLTLLDSPTFTASGMSRVELEKAFITYFGSNSKEATNRTWEPKSQKMKQSLHSAYTKPMFEAIKEEMGSVSDTMQLLIRMSQYQNAVAMSQFKAIRDEYLAEKFEKASSNNLSRLTPNDMAEIFERANKFNPRYETQDYIIDLGSRENIPTDVVTAKSADNRFSIHLRTPEIENVGVSAAPNVNIISGDATAVNTMYSKEYSDMAPLDNTLPVFDGIEIAAQSADEQSLHINRAAFDAWGTNPFAAVLENYQQTLDIMPSIEDMDQDAIITMYNASLTENMDRLTKDNYNPEKAAQYAYVIRNGMNDVLGQAEVALKGITARKDLERSVPSYSDHMAVIEASYDHVGSMVISATTPLDEQLAIKYAEQAEYNETKPERMQERLQRELYEVAKPISYDGTTILKVSAEDMVQAMRKSKLLMGENYGIVRPLLKMLENTPVFLGSTVGLAKHKAALGSTDNTPVALGQFDPSTNAIFLKETTAETLIHELIHAASFQKIADYYSNPLALSNEERQAVDRLVSIKDELLSSPDMFTESQATMDAYYNLLNAVNKAPTQAHALNEVMAWTLANQKLRAKTKTVALKNAFSRVLGALLRTLRAFIGEVHYNVGNDALSNIRFNLDILTARAPTTPPDGNSFWASMNMATSNNAKTVERMFNDKLSEALKAYLNDPIKTQKLRKEFTGVKVDATITANRLRKAGFDINPGNNPAYRAIFSVLATELQLNPGALVQINRLYKHVMDALTVESFMENPTVNDPNDRAQADEKYNAIIKGVGGKDRANRSTLLPSFIALAHIDDQFREILNKIDLPKTVNLKWDSVDNALTSIGTTAVESASVLLGGSSRKAKNTTEALDSLVESLATIDADAGETYLVKAGKLVHDANTFVSDKIQSTVKTVYDGLGVFNNSPKASVRTMSRLAQTVLTPLNEEIAKDNAKFVTSVMNTGKFVPQTVMEFWNEIQMMTTDNAGILSLSKKAKTFVSGLRQDYRENMPKAISKFFNKPVTNASWTTMQNVLAKTDLVSLLGSFTKNEVLDLIRNPTSLDKSIRQAETVIGRDPFIMAQSKALAVSMTGGTQTYIGMLNNAKAIAAKLGTQNMNLNPTASEVQAVDVLTTLYALKALPVAELEAMAAIITDEPTGVDTVLSFLQEMNKEEDIKVGADDAARFNARKGYIPETAIDGSSLIVASMNDADRLRQEGYEYVQRFNGNPRERMGYFYNAVGNGPTIQQGALQTVSKTFKGVNAYTGRTIGTSAGQIITGQAARDYMLNKAGQTIANGESGRPIFNGKGQVIAVEFALDPKVNNRQSFDTNLSRMIGVWRGRQIEETFSAGINNQLFGEIRKLWDDNKMDHADEFVDLTNAKDPIHKDTWNKLPSALKARIMNEFPEGFMIRKDMLNNTVGYTSASVGDLFTGTSRIKPEIREATATVLTNMLGARAYRILVQGEKFAQKVVSEAKNIIVIRSIIVPAANIASNFLQLVSQGVPLKDAVKGSVSKINELNLYVENRKRLIDIDAEMIAFKHDGAKVAKLKAEQQSIKDSHRRMTIWPVIEQFSTIAEDLSPVDGSLRGGRWIEALEKAVDKLPASVRTAGKYAIISRDTALYKLLDQATQYGDFIAKSVYYDHLISKGVKHEDAMREITDEFVNYDYLPGRVRTYFDSVGITWFWNFKVRSIKVALNILRNNPLTAILALTGAGLIPNMISAGSPVSDNLIGKIMDGGISRSVGWDMLWDTPSLLPTVDALS